MTDYRAELPKVRRCQMCGKLIEENEGGATKIFISDARTFFNKFGVDPIRMETHVCGRCNSFFMEWSGAKTEAERMITLFAEPAPDFEKTWRADLEKRDMAQYFATIQAAFRTLEDYIPVKADICVKRVFEPEAQCPYKKGKRNREKCNDCIRRWLVSESPHSGKGVQTVQCKKRVRANYGNF